MVGGPQGSLDDRFGLRVFLGAKVKNLFPNTVDGSEILRSPVEVGSL